MSTAVSLGFGHEALLYSGMAGFLAGTTVFLRRAARDGDPVLAVVPSAKIDMLRRTPGLAAASVSFADMAGIGGNPARLLAVWRAFAQAHDGAKRLWGIGEPISPGRSRAELAECHLHEGLLNVAFDASGLPFAMLCAYDLKGLGAGVIEDARRTHPWVTLGGDRQPSRAFRPIDLAGPFARPLPPGPAAAARMAVEPGGFRAVRAFVAGQAQRAGLDQKAAADLVLAVHELATNSVRHGGGHGELRAWTDGPWLVCEVSDHGHITAPLAGRLPPTLDGRGGAGLWTASQICDLVQIHSTAEGTVIRVSQHL